MAWIGHSAYVEGTEGAMNKLAETIDAIPDSHTVSDRLPVPPKRGKEADITAGIHSGEVQIIPRASEDESYCWDDVT
jgi:hypothetical protein